MIGKSLLYSGSKVESIDYQPLMIMLATSNLCLAALTKFNIENSPFTKYVFEISVLSKNTETLNIKIIDSGICNIVYGILTSLCK